MRSGTLPKATKIPSPPRTFGSGELALACAAKGAGSRYDGAEDRLGNGSSIGSSSASPNIFEEERFRGFSSFRGGVGATGVESTGASAAVNTCAKDGDGAEGGLDRWLKEDSGANSGGTYESGSGSAAVEIGITGVGA